MGRAPKQVARFSPDCATSAINEGYVEPSFLSQVGLFLTLRCPAHCRHCMIGSGPHRTEEIALDEAIDWLHQIAAYSDGHIKSVGFTGGEPFWCLDKLLVLAQTARQMGLTCTVVTNGFWAKSREHARAILAQVQPSDVSVSTDIYHTEYIPVENAQHVYEACRELGIRCDILVTYDPRELDATRAHVQRILTFAPREAIRTTRVFPSGRGTSQADFCDGSDNNKAASMVPCLFSTVPYILPNGDIFPCVGPVINLPRANNPLYLGSLRDRSLATIFDDSQGNPILHALRIWGVRFWHLLIESYGPASLLPNGYYTDCPCEGCIALLENPEIAAFLSEAVRSQGLISSVHQARRMLLHEQCGRNL